MITPTLIKTCHDVIVEDAMLWKNQSQLARTNTGHFIHMWHIKK